MIRLPTVGARICAIDHAIVYSPAYSPRLLSEVLEIQKVFINGILMISARVINNTQLTATIAVRGRIL